MTTASFLSSFSRHSAAYIWTLGVGALHIFHFDTVVIQTLLHIWVHGVMALYLGLGIGVRSEGGCSC